MRYLRGRKGLTQEGLANRSGLTRVFIGQLERGTTNVSIDSLFLLCKALSIDFPELVAGVHELAKAEETLRRRQRVAKPKSTRESGAGSTRAGRLSILRGASRPSTKGSR
ncbi:helix-turn-helix domain-containing protein [Paraburkholderia caribensis]|uniref:helix-turn-helix domain-containing protein n=1 Tax=Paraburkholderia caribensis TaxID=75105 RepID=UPI0009EB1945|nr:helix-turn-helix domain-containing protein [Paraburkholderia caribensis]